jgi:hypothetical protein
VANRLTPGNRRTSTATDAGKVMTGRSGGTDLHCRRGCRGVSRRVGLRRVGAMGVGVAAAQSAANSFYHVEK